MGGCDGGAVLGGFVGGGVVGVSTTPPEVAPAAFLKPPLLVFTQHVLSADVKVQKVHFLGAKPVYA